MRGTDCEGLDEDATDFILVWVVITSGSDLVCKLRGSFVATTTATVKLAGSPRPE